MRAAVVGHPVARSLSPALHAAAYAALGLAGWDYGWRELGAGELGSFLGRLGGEWAGLSVTIPLKGEALALVEEASDLARAVGAVNTVLPLPSTGGPSRWRGENTDVHGIVAAARTAAVLGGGATAASALAALATLGVRDAAVHVRSAQRASVVLAAAQRLGVAPRLRPFDAVEELLDVDVVVSTVPGGAADAVAAAVADAGRAAPRGVLLDVVYAPWPTALGAAWSGRGATAVPGFTMLLHQAGEQVRLMTGQGAPLEAMRAAGLAELAAR